MTCQPAPHPSLQQAPPAHAHMSTPPSQPATRAQPCPTHPKTPPALQTASQRGSIRLHHPGTPL
eukprot:3328469-Pleurochrysis_carterae.AAC.1